MEPSWKRMRERVWFVDVQNKCSYYVLIVDFSEYQMWAFRQTDKGVRKVSALCGGPAQLALDLRLPQQSPVHAPAQSQPSTLFFAVLPTPVAAERIAARAERLRHQHGLRAKRRPTELLHVTLNAVGSFSGLPADLLAAAIYAGTSVRMAPFKVTLDSALSFRTRPPLPFVLRSGHGTAELTTLRNAIGAAMRHIGFRFGNHSNFTPHMTMLYTIGNLFRRRGSTSRSPGRCASSCSCTAS